jgi:hypothetical protein
MTKNEIYTAIALITIILISVICIERLNNSRRIVETFPEYTGKPCVIELKPYERDDYIFRIEEILKTLSAQSGN